MSQGAKHKIKTHWTISSALCPHFPSLGTNYGRFPIPWDCTALASKMLAVHCHILQGKVVTDSHDAGFVHPNW